MGLNDLSLTFFSPDYMTGWRRFLIYLALFLGLCLPVVRAELDSPSSAQFFCRDLVTTSLPPNINWLNHPDPTNDHTVFVTTGVGQWVEYVLPLTTAGSYRLQATLLTGSDFGAAQLFVDDVPVGKPLDLYSASSPSATNRITIDLGNVTFLKPGNKLFRLEVTGKNPSSSGYVLGGQAFRLSSTNAFTLLSPNGACFPDGRPLLRWPTQGELCQYDVYVDDLLVGTVKGTSWQTQALKPGGHFWFVVAKKSDGHESKSNRFTFYIGSAPAYGHREFSDDFSGGNLDSYVAEGASLQSTAINGQHTLLLKSNGQAYLKEVTLEKLEGEVSALVTLDSANTTAGVGFIAGDGAKICVLLDAQQGVLRLERWVKSYSIFDITPAQYRVKAWQESRRGDYYVWQLQSKPALLKVGEVYRIKLGFSRRSFCVLASLSDEKGVDLLSLRDLVDLRTPSHPLMFTDQGEARFADFSYKRLNKKVYKWDVDTNQIVLKPGSPGEWDARGAFNPAIVIKEGTWYMTYRGNPNPAPPNGPMNSQIGLATSVDGTHWQKYASNPIVKKSAPSDSVEDPDMIFPAGDDAMYLEFNHAHHEGEEMVKSTDGFHYSEPWPLPTRGVQSGKVSGFVDTHSAPMIPDFSFNGSSYRFLAIIEEGPFFLSNDLHNWVKAGKNLLKGEPSWWCDGKECVGGIFVDADKNIRMEAQAGTNGAIVGNRLCTIMEDVLSGSDPATVLWRGDLPWLPDWYGNAPTGDLNEMTFTNGSVFPGQIIVKDGWLWHYYGGNNTFVGLMKCFYGPVFEYRNLQVSPGPAATKMTVTATVRNIGSLSGTADLPLLLDGASAGLQAVTLSPDTETQLAFTIDAPTVVATVALDDLRATVVPPR